MDEIYIVSTWNYVKHLVQSHNEFIGLRRYKNKIVTNRQSMEEYL